MPKKVLINDQKIDGSGLLTLKFPSLHKRQIWAIYDQAVKDGLSYEETANADIHIGNPNADIGEDFNVTITVKA